MFHSEISIHLFFHAIFLFLDLPLRIFPLHSFAVFVALLLLYLDYLIDSVFYHYIQDRYLIYLKNLCLFSFLTLFVALIFVLNPFSLELMFLLDSFYLLILLLILLFSMIIPFQIFLIYLAILDSFFFLLKFLV